MRSLQTDLSIYEKFNFEKPPVSVKFLYDRPDGIEQLDKSMPIFEMIKEAQQRSGPFYITKKNENCVGKAALGMLDEPAPSSSGSGEIGVKLGIFAEARANRRIYQQTPKMPGGYQICRFFLRRTS